VGWSGLDRVSLKNQCGVTQISGATQKSMWSNLIDHET
jgi:hypothetical protein